MAEKNTGKNEETRVFHSYLSTTVLMVGAILTGFLIAVAVILVAIPMYPLQPALSIVIIVAGICFALAVTAGTFVLTNMSDDQKLIAESLQEFQADSIQRQNMMIESLYEQEKMLVTLVEQQDAYQKQALVFYEIIAKNTLKERE